MTWKIHKGHVQPAPLQPVESHAPVALAGLYDSPPLTWTQRVATFLVSLIPANEDERQRLDEAMDYIVWRVQRQGPPYPTLPRIGRFARTSTVRQRRAAQRVSE